MEALQFVGAAAGRALLIRTVGNRMTARAVPFPYIAGSKTLSLVRGEVLPDARKRSHVAWWGDERRFTLFSNNDARPQVVADYSVLSSYELSASKEELFAQIGNEGHSVTLYQRGFPLQLGEAQWRD